MTRSAASLRARLVRGAAAALLLWLPSAPAAAAFEDAAAEAGSWLEANQNADGSWGTTEALRGLATSEAVIALRAVGLRREAYFRGVTWLENHAVSSNDYRARRVVALAPHGDDLSADQEQLAESFSVANAFGAGWGLSGTYAGSALDTALVLQAVAALGLPPAVAPEVAAAVGLLAGLQAQGSDGGWPATLGAGGASDPVTTALVLEGYAALVGLTTGFQASGDLAETWLLGAVTAGDTPLVQARAALAVLRWSPGTTGADAWLAGLQSTQAGDGSWAADPYVTAAALRAFAAKLGTDDPLLQAKVVIPDLGLRAAINLALGKSRVDAITRGEMLTLTDLDASDLGIEDLTGIEVAQNLESIDLRGNTIADLSPLDALPNLTTILLAYACDVDGDGRIGAADALILLRAIGEGTPLSPAQMTAADVAPPGAPDGLLTVGDALPLLRAAGGESVAACGN